MPMPPLCVRPGTLTLLCSPVCPNVTWLGYFTWSPTLYMPSSVLPSCPMFLPSIPSIVSALPLKNPLLPGLRPIYSPVVLVLILPRPPEGAAYRDPNSGLMCVPVPIWWGVLGVPWPVSTTSGSFSTLTSSSQLQLVSHPPPTVPTLHLLCSFSDSWNLLVAILNLR